MADINELLMAAHGDLERVRAILDEQPELVNDAGTGQFVGETPLGAAAHMGSRAIAELLLERGAELDIFAAAMLGMGERVDGFLDADPALAQGRNPRAHGIPLLHFAVVGDQLEVLQRLVERGADVGSLGALHTAAGFGRLRIAEWLLAQGVDPNATNWDGSRPLHNAAGRGNVEMCRLLMAHGADVMAKNGQGKTPREVAEARGHGDVAGMLAEMRKEE